MLSRTLFPPSKTRAFNFITSPVLILFSLISSFIFLAGFFLADTTKDSSKSSILAVIFVFPDFLIVKFPKLSNSATFLFFDVKTTFELSLNIFALSYTSTA